METNRQKKIGALLQNDLVDILQGEIRKNGITKQMKKKKESRDLTGSRPLFLIHRPSRKPYGVNVEW